MLSSSQFHSDFKALAISTTEVGVNGLKLTSELKAEALVQLLREPGSDFAWQSFESCKVFFEIERETNHAFKVHVKADLILHCACVRCLNLVGHKVPLNFSIRMIEDEEKKLKDEEPGEFSLDSDSILDEGDFPVGYFSRRSIDLGLILREQIFLEIPDYPKCGGDMAISREACRTQAELLSEVPARENPFVKLLKKT